MRGFLLFFLFVTAWALVYSVAALRARKRTAAAVPTPRGQGRPADDGAEVNIGGRRVRMPQPQWTATATASVIGLLVGLVAVIVVSRCWVEVGPAETMAIYDPTRGGIQARDYGEGWHFLAPWVRTEVFSKRMEEYTMSVMPNEGAMLGDDSMSCQTKEGLGIKIDATVVFRIPENGANRLWKAVGPDYARIVVRPDTRNVVRLVVANYGIMEVYSNAPEEYAAPTGTDFFVGKRKQIEQEIEKELRRQFAEKGLDLLLFLFRNVDYDAPQFAEQIVAKQVAQQQVVTQQFRAQAAKIRANAQVQRAEGDAKAIQLKAQALRINSGVVDLEWIDQLKPDQVILLPGGATPLLQLPRVDASPPPAPAESEQPRGRWR